MSKKKDKSLDIDSLFSEVDATKAHEVEALFKKLKSRMKDREKQYQELLVDFEEYKTASAFIAGLEEEVQDPRPIKPKSSTGESESIAIACGADWHAFEMVKPEQVNGLNEYNPNICKASAETFFRTVCRWIEIHRAGTEINTLVMSFLGDLISGTLHEDQIEGNAGTTLEECLFVCELVIAGLEYILEHSGCSRIIVCTVDGNHSRITMKQRKANRAKHSLEWFIFHFIRTHFEVKGEDRMEWNISDGLHLYLPLEYGMDAGHPTRTLRFTHGDEGIRYQGGVGGLAVPARRSIKNWNIGRHADLTIFGHHHTSEYPRTYVAVGSLMGYSPYSLAGRYEFEKPQQAFLMIEKKRWVTAYHSIYVR